MLMALCVIAGAMRVCSAAMRFCGFVVLLGGLVVHVLGHFLLLSREAASAEAAQCKRP
jgi:hypothetical protein